MQKHTLHRAGAACAIAGAIIAGVFNAIHPEPVDSGAFLALVAGTPNWAAIHWGLMVGLVLMQLGFAAFMLTLRDPAEKQDAGGWGLLGVYTLLVGTALWVGLFALEAALKPVAEAATADPGLRGTATAVALVGDAIQTAATFVYWVGIALLGIALAVSMRYPRWLGGIGVVVGVVMAVGVGLVRAFAGANPWTEKLGFPILAILTLVWTVVLGGFLWRLSAPPRAKRRR